MAPKGKQDQRTKKVPRDADDDYSPRKGLRAVKPAESPFWAPWDEDAGHPNPIEGVYMGERTLPKHGKFKEQTVIDVVLEGGDSYTVAYKGNLPRLMRGAGKLSAGQQIAIEWTGKEEPSEKLPMGQNIFKLWVE